MRSTVITLQTGRNEYTLQYPNNVVDSGPFVICIDVGFEWLYCGDGYNAEEKRPENAYIRAQEYGLNEEIREEEQQEQQEEEQSQSQDQTIIVCPANDQRLLPIIQQDTYDHHTGSLGLSVEEVDRVCSDNQITWKVTWLGTTFIKD